MQDKNEIIKNAMRHMGKPIDEITRRNTYRARSPGVKPTSGIKLILPKTSSMAMKMQRILDDESAEGRKKQKQMANLVIGREDDGKEISLEFKTAASRERFRKMMNESVELGEMKKSDGPFTARERVFVWTHDPSRKKELGSGSVARSSPKQGPWRW